MKLNSLIRNKHADRDTKIDTLWRFLEHETFSYPVLLQMLRIKSQLSKLRAMTNTNYKVNAAASA